MSKKIDMTKEILESFNKDEFDNQENRIRTILGCVDREYDDDYEEEDDDYEEDEFYDMEVNSENINKYFKFLKGNIKKQCHMTGIEDFQWEEKYIFGFGDKKEYEKLKKERPSYKDIFEFIDFEIIESQIFAKVKRVSDKKKFELPLDNLKVVDKKSENYQILDDYCVWYVNY